MKEIAMGRWRDNCNNLTTLENGAFTIVRRLRQRLLRRAFDLYLAGSKYHKKREIEEQRIIMYRETRAKRLLQKAYQSWVGFKDDFVRAKLYWNRIYSQMDFAMKNRAVKKWKAKTKGLALEELRDS